MWGKNYCYGEKLKETQPTRPQAQTRPQQVYWHKVTNTYNVVPVSNAFVALHALGGKVPTPICVTYSFLVIFVDLTIITTRPIALTSRIVTNIVIPIIASIALASHFDDLYSNTNAFKIRGLHVVVIDIPIDIINSMTYLTSTTTTLTIYGYTASTFSTFSAFITRLLSLLVTPRFIFLAHTIPSLLY